MELGPVEVVIFTFPQPDIDAGVITTLGETVRSGAVNLIDLVLVTRDGDGRVHIRDLEDDLPEAWADVLVDSRPLTLLSDADLEVAAESVGNNEAAVVAAFEHKWAQPLSAEVRRAGGTTALHVRIPRDTVNAALDASAAAK
ncbi:DUF1269 domain-containing protein [Arthrobacter sp. Sa2CUA1]|uniref:DUF1269 domain-containing protein n=1 Tax=Arthrobacter gallicola TaxID=2762225 RepID=A0ABR8UN23_9MICC|nr:DUF6325 family protein [Arthrobacter gallicola]MBD7993954.1 DUF1269 domain-containing protein [Arthrobacter gallicola]